MKLLSLDLLRFGPFTGAVLDLSSRPRALHVIVGSNAVGKSTSLRAVTDLLFGIPHATSDNHLHENPALRIGGRLATEDGRELAVIRRKGNKSTLVDLADKPVDEGVITALLGGLAREQFETMFGLSHERLVEGGKALLAGKGDVGESLFSAGLGGAGIQQLLRRLEREADEIFRPNGKLQPLNKAIAAFKELSKKAADLSLQTKDWDAVQKDLAAQLQLSETLDARLRTLRADERSLRRIQSALAPVARRAELLTQLEACGAVVTLPESAAEERRSAERTLAEAHPAEVRLRDEIVELHAKLAALSVPDELLAREPALKQLGLDLGSHLKAASDLPRRRVELRLLEDGVKGLLRGLGRELGLDDIDTLALEATLETRMRTLALQRGKVESALLTAQSEQEEKEDRLALERRKLDGLAEPPAVEGLRRAVATAREEGALERRARDQGIDVEAKRAALMRGHASLGLWTGPVESIGALAVPAAESIDRFEKSLADLTAKHGAEVRRAEDLRAKLVQIKQRLETLERSAAVPTEDDLAAARRKREHTWEQVRQDWLGEGAKAAHAPALATEHEGDVRAADDVADRLRREADRVAQFASLLATRAAEEAEIGEIEQRLTRLEGEQRAELDRWRALWRPAGIEPLSPLEMRSWLLRYRKVVDDREQWSEAQRASAGSGAQIAAHRQALSDELVAAGRDPVGASESLAAAIARADGVLAEADVRERERTRLASSIGELAAEAARQKGAAAKQAAALSTWQQSWVSVTAALGLPPTALPEEAEDIVKQRKELLAKADALKAMRRRVDTIEEDARAFAARVDELVRTAAPDLAAFPLERRAELLLSRFEAGGKDRVERGQLARRCQDKKEALATLAVKREAAARELQRLVDQGHCATAAELPEAERRSDEVRALRRELTAVDAELRNLSEGAGIDALIAECKGQHADVVHVRLRDRELEIETADRERKGPDQKVGELRAQLQSMNGGDQAAVAAERAQQELASIRSYVEDYARARLAGVLLHEEINRYRERNQGPILRRASELFQALTLDTFARLETVYDDQDAPLIQCVRKDDRSVGVEGLSDGTRDQLFLALRVASMERHLERNEPVPVIVDDILINFDDRRARAALGVLGELATRTQVLFFTHHRHLAELAGEVVAREVMVRHDLDALAGRSVA